MLPKHMSYTNVGAQNPAYVCFCPTVKELEAKLQTALNDSQRKEDLMVMRLNAKEQELQDYVVSRC